MPRGRNEAHERREAKAIAAALRRHTAADRFWLELFRRLMRLITKRTPRSGRGQRQRK